MYIFQIPKAAPYTGRVPPACGPTWQRAGPGSPIPLVGFGPREHRCRDDARRPATGGGPVRSAATGGATRWRSPYRSERRRALGGAVVSGSCWPCCADSIRASRWASGGLVRTACQWHGEGSGPCPSRCACAGCWGRIRGGEATHRRRWAVEWWLTRCRFTGCFPCGASSSDPFSCKSGSSIHSTFSRDFLFVFLLQGFRKKFEKGIQEIYWKELKSPWE